MAVGVPGDSRTGVFLRLVLILSAAGTVLAGFGYAVISERDHRQAVGKQLESIAELKVLELSLWRKERLGNGSVLQGDAYFSENAGRFLLDRNDAQAGAWLLSRLRQVRAIYDYDRLFLMDSAGAILSSWPETGTDDPVIAAAAPAFIREGAVGFLDFYRNPADSRAYLTVMVPVGQETGRGILAMRIDPERYLYPYIMRWPAVSSTAETLIVRREGNEVVFLNRNRFDDTAALRLRFPLDSGSELPAAQAVLGNRGLFFGKDYRENRVLAVLTSVGDSPWFLVSKMNLAEVDAGVRDRRLMLILLAAALLGAETAGVLAVRNRWKMEALGREVETKAARELEMAGINAELENRVAERTALLEASNKELEAFAYSAAHDLRTPLRSIDGFARILQEDYEKALGPEGARLLGIIRSSDQKMDELIGGLLDLTRIGRIDPNIAEVDMRACAIQAYRSCADIAVLGDFEFEVGTLPEALADPSMIARVWTNLLSNAVKYSVPSDAHKITVTGRTEDGMNIYSVRDRGIGFDQRYAGKLFNLFQRLHGVDQFPGSGIGLAIVKRIVERHGGWVRAEGSPGEGAEFQFSIPILERSQP
ncbi:MAG: hypothetical protein A2Z99_06590 [Treponema sp. GWB1_62_6]|nr:MAG: hypothetical protein A2001_10895 [Treponema sp. GWC1_61_84]OHE68043.1 MAG: hypothetical protein A2Z99_06590 [Treponema sp. GWB1_62_6]OHE68932.1 MAG: hypothetical protein A2413_07820 [Treponema sp. RIFOXYC1_FULL_61_9]